MLETTRTCSEPFWKGLDPLKAWFRAADPCQISSNMCEIFLLGALQPFEMCFGRRLRPAVLITGNTSGNTTPLCNGIPVGTLPPPLKYPPPPSDPPPRVGTVTLAQKA